jgi:hypothetical protein
MSIQSIINIAESIQINRRKVIGIQYTRNEIARVSELVTRNPWRMTVQVSALLDYRNTNVRALLEELDRLDRKIPEEITFANNSRLAWMFAYQGNLTPSELSALRITAFGSSELPYNQIALQGLPTVGANSLPGAVLFRKGDIIQVSGYPYPFTVQNTTVLRGSGSSVTITTHRENFIDESVVNTGIVVGPNVEFNMFCTNMPTYTFVEKNLVKFDGSFELYEYTGTIL